MKKLPKLQKGDKVAILSPSFAAPGMFPEVFELGLTRLRDVFELEPVEFPTTRKLGASKEERAKDLIDAFSDPEIKAVIATIGGDDQVTYIKNLPGDVFANNPKPYFGYSDNTHFMNFLWLNGVPSFYGGSIMTQFAMQGEMDAYTVEHLKNALFGGGEVELKPSEMFNEVGLDWSDVDNLKKTRELRENAGWVWDGDGVGEGITWGGCVESIDEIMRHGLQMPTIDQFDDVVLLLETSEELPSASYVARVVRALGERGILERVKGVVVGRPKAWEFDKQNAPAEREGYREDQRATILKSVRAYNESVPIVQNVEIGHTDPQCIMPYGGRITVDGVKRSIVVEY
ncbi:LD-carboxypeptidase [Candidatus Uhrbacteria bacterium]|nr:LD-carboxypeptidase [Candidatus Uhrbacteria bacterium]